MFLLLALNTRYTAKEKYDMIAPYRRTEDLGGVVAFPLMVPVRPEDNYVTDFRNARIFLAEKCHFLAYLCLQQNLVIIYKIFLRIIYEYCNRPTRSYFFSDI